MEPKLQQAIVATRAGRVEVAQRLLTQLLTEDPQSANAWYLLSYLVETPERQIRYLRKTVEISPEHELARKRLGSLTAGTVPPPVIRISDAPFKIAETTAAVAPLEPPRPVQPQVTAPQPVDSPQGTAAQPGSGRQQLPDWLQDLENKRLTAQSANRALDAEWRKTAGTPKRSMSVTEDPSGTPARAPEAEKESKSTPGEVWLARGLIALAILAGIILIYLVFLILI
jgi:hypothetical protein